jgi:hypothetical protein
LAVAIKVLMAAALVGTSEGPVLAPYGAGAQLALGGVIRHAEPPIVDARHLRTLSKDKVSGFTN